MKSQLTKADLPIVRLAGLLYLVIIVSGIGSEMLLRGPLVDIGDAGGTAAAILDAVGTYRLSFMADLVMATADIALGVILFVLFRPVAPTLALAAMVFRLVQAVIIGVNLLNMQAALLLISGAQDSAALTTGQPEALATLFLNLHAHGYDLGLVFFGVNSLITACLILRSGFVPRFIGIGVGVAGAVYLIGSALRFLAPAGSELFAPAYGLTLLTEGAFCLWLLLAFRPMRQPRPA